MMKLLSLIVFTFVSFSVFSADSAQPHHAISLDSDGLGWSGLRNLFNWDDSKTAGIKDQNSSIGKLYLNYNYILENRVMVGLQLEYDKESIETKYASGRKKTQDDLNSSLAVSVGYNFNEDLFNSWWIKGFIGSGKINSESTDSSASPTTTKTDINVGFVTMEAGKRISLSSWGLKNFSYSPSLAITSASYSNDAKSVGLKSSTSARLNLIKFDIVF